MDKARDKAIEKIKFEEKWLKNLLIENNLDEIDIENSFMSIIYAVEKIGEMNE